MANIALVDPLSHGHHIAFFRIFTKTLLDQGHRVIAFHNIEEIKLQRWLTDHQIDFNERLEVIQLIRPSVSSYLFLKNRKVLSVLKSLKFWLALRNSIREFRKSNDAPIDFCFFAWLDSYLSAFLPRALIDLLLPYKWSGLYFHPRHMRLDKNAVFLSPTITSIDNLLLSKNCVSVGVHDEHILETYGARLNKPIVFFPEIADNSEPEKNNPIAREIKRKAKNRTVIGTIGLQKHKGTLTMLRVAKKMENDPFFFAFIGAKTKETYSKLELEEMNDIYSSPPENCFFSFTNLGEGGEYNAVFSSFDIIFLVYNNFTSSSNRLTKESIFKKHVIASDRYCIGEDVKKYDLGICVQSNDPWEIKDALTKLKTRIDKGTEGDFKIYCEKHSWHNLHKSFDEAISLTL